MGRLEDIARRLANGLVVMEITWPDGGVAYLDVEQYCRLDADALEGARVRFVNLEKRPS